MILVVVDLSENLESADHELLAKAAEGGRCLLVGNKADLPRLAKLEGSEFAIVSALTGEGIEELRLSIRAKAVPELDPFGEGAFVTNLRHENLLRESLERLGKAREGGARGRAA